MQVFMCILFILAGDSSVEFLLSKFKMASR